MCLHSLGDSVYPSARKGPNTQRKYSATCTASRYVLFKQREVLLLIKQSVNDWTRDKRSQRTFVVVLHACSGGVNFNRPVKYSDYWLPTGYYLQSCKCCKQMLIWQASYFSIMKHTGKIREFIWKQHPFGIMIVYTIGVKAFVSLHYGHFRWSIRRINSCTCISFREILQGKK